MKVGVLVRNLPMEANPLAPSHRVMRSFTDRPNLDRVTMDSAQNDDILARLSALTERNIAEIERLQNQPVGSRGLGDCVLGCSDSDCKAPPALT